MNNLHIELCEVVMPSQFHSFPQTAKCSSYKKDVLVGLLTVVSICSDYVEDKLQGIVDRN